MSPKTNPMHKLTALVTPFAVLLVYAMLTVQPVHATFPGTNGQIVFTQGDFFNGVPASVVTADPDGFNHQVVPLGDLVEFVSAPVWSADGSKLLSSHTLRIDPSTGQCCLPFRPAIVSPDGVGYTLLTIPDAPFDMDCLAWSRDQRRLLCGFGGSQPGVFSIRASDGGDSVRLTTNPYAATGGIDTPGDLSPDGRQFLFVRTKTKMNPNDPDPESQPALFVENADGTGLRQLTASGKAKFGLPPIAHWSPDGKRIIGALGNGKMFTINPDGSKFSDVDLQVGAPYFAYFPTWSPDGKRIIFCIFINGGEGISSANPDGSNIKQVTFSTDFSSIFHGTDWGTHPLQ